MHKMQSGGWPYSKVSRDSENLESTVSSSSCSSCSCYVQVMMMLPYSVHVLFMWGVTIVNHNQDNEAQTLVVKPQTRGNRTITVCRIPTQRQEGKKQCIRVMVPCVLTHH